MEQDILAIFREISKIPRKSGHETAIGRYITEKIKALRLAVVQDERGNVIAEKPASAGRENDPVVILQAHMDMVCAAAEGVAYDPLRDPIRVKQADGFLYAEGTSLGADDGIGVAVILYLLGTEFSHGPLRAVFTVDEESGMTGAKNLAAAHLAADYLINCDSEDVNKVTVSSAGSVNIDFLIPFREERPAKGQALAIELKGFAGGHSGIDINSGRANAVKVLGICLDKIRQKGVSFELAEISGGTAPNAIPAHAGASLCVDARDKAAVERAIADTAAYIKNIWGEAEPSASVSARETDRPQTVLDHAAAEKIVALLTLLHTGVYSMAPSDAAFVETSANIGLLGKKKGHIALNFFARSSADEKLADFQRMACFMAAAIGAEVDVSALSPAWPAKQRAVLPDVIREEYFKLTGAPMQKEKIHAGLECSFFRQKNKALDMASIGPTVTDVHSPNEKLKLSTLEIHVKTIMNTLARLKGPLRS